MATATAHLTISGSGAVVVNGPSNLCSWPRQREQGDDQPERRHAGHGPLDHPGHHPDPGDSIVNFNGGTLEALADNTAWISDITSANVQAGGAYIDTNGQT